MLVCKFVWYLPGMIWTFFKFCFLKDCSILRFLTFLRHKIQMSSLCPKLNFINAYTTNTLLILFFMSESKMFVILNEIWMKLYLTSFWGQVQYFSSFLTTFLFSSCLCKFLIVIFALFITIWQLEEENILWIAFLRWHHIMK